MMPEREQKKRERAGERPQRFGGLGRGVDVGYAVGMQRRRRGDDDEKADDVRQHHAGRWCRARCEGPRVAPDDWAARRRPRRLVALAAQLASLRFERGLPEEHVGTDRGAEDRHQHQHVIAIPRQARQEGRGEHLAPWNPNGESGGDIGEEHERQRLQVSRIGMIRNQDFGGEAADAEQRDVDAAPGRRRRAATHRPSPRCRRRC